MATAFGITKTNYENDVDFTDFIIALPFGNRLTTETGTDGGTVTEWTATANNDTLKELTKENILILRYSATDDSMQCYELDNYYAQTGTITTSAPLGYDVIIMTAAKL